MQWSISLRRREISRICKKDGKINIGQIRNIHFPFDIEADTSISVATEMVAELDLTDQDVTAIAAMIDAEIQAHVPEWVPGEGLEDDQANTPAGSETPRSEAEDELRALPNEVDQFPGVLVLERLPSGRKYWSDSPKGSSGSSPVAFSHSNRSSNSHCSNEFHPEVYEKLEHLPKLDDPKSNKSAGDDLLLVNSTTACDQNEVEGEYLESIVRKLEELFVEQQNEIMELKREHSLAVAQLLQGVPPELRTKIFNTCRVKFRD